MPSIYPEAPPISGLVAGKYELVRMIGRGGMGAVWEGKHTSLGKRVAIKFIDAEYAESQEARARFDNEARAAASIESRHAIAIYDHGVTDDGRPYIVMELLVGEPLDRRIERLGRVTLTDTARILMQVCRALQRAHDAGVIHRDLKPENIFLVRAPDEDDEIAKVLDFGIAKIQPPPGHTSARGGVSSSTKTGAVLGTPYYMSPEQARGLRGVDFRTDLWSLGVIAYKCVAGVLPFEGESVGDLLVKICTGPIPVPSHAVPELPSSFDAWFARALDREPQQRFSSASELSESLAFAAGIGGRGPSLGAGAASMPSPPAGRSAALTPQLAVTPGAASPAMTASPFTRNSTSRAPTSARGIWIAAAVACAIGLGVGAIAFLKLGATRDAAGAHATASGSSARPAASSSASAASASSASSAASGSAAPALPSLAPGAAIETAPLTSAPPPRPKPTPGVITPLPAKTGPASKPLAPRPPPPPPPADPGY